MSWFDSPKQVDDSGPKSWDDYDRAVLDGLPVAETDRMREASRSLRYSLGYFDDIDAERSGSASGGATLARSDRWDDAFSEASVSYAKSDFVVAAPIAKAVTEKLSENLYKRAPTRTLRDASASALLNRLYQANGMAGKFQEADRLTAVGGVSAWQFAGDSDPRRPVKVHLWGADQLCVWTAPDDPTEVAAVCAIDRHDGRRRAQLWTRDKVRYYATRRGAFPADATRKFDPLGPAKPNPYRGADGKGVLPFAFNHFRHPSCEFTTDAPGPRIAELNRYLNFAFDDTAEGVRYLAKPVGVATGVDAGWQFPAVVRPGMFLKLAAGMVDVGANGPMPDLRYLSADLQWVGVVWQHFNNYLDLCLELEGIPPSTIRMVLNARSGVSILAEQAPLLGWTERRRRSWHDYETAAASTFLRVAAAHLRNHGRAPDANRLEGVADEPELRLQWPRLYVDLPGPERDRADGVRIDWGFASLVDIVQERQDCTEDEAFDQLKRVAEHNKKLEAMGINPKPTGQAGGGGFGEAPPGADEQDQATADVGGGDNPAELDQTAADVGNQADAKSGEGG